MSYRDLQGFVADLRSEGELVEVDVPADTLLEIPEIHRRVIAAGGPALLFKNPQGPSGASGFPLVTNLFGSAKRVEMAFGGRPKAFVERTVQMAHELMPPSLGKLWDNRDWIQQGMSVGMKRTARGPVTEVIDDPPALDRLPMLHTWKEDGGHFITLPLVYTEHPDNGSHNLGMYRIQRYDAQTTGMHIQILRGAGAHLHIAESRGQDLPATIFAGGPPALILSAIAPLPENVPELVLASLLQGERLQRCDNPVGPHPLVANAEFALVGNIAANERRPEGPFGDHYGYYSLKHDYPVFHCKALCHRKDAIFPATVVGKPRQEDFFLGDYLQELLSPLFPLVMPTVVDLWSYGETGYHSLAGAVVKDRFPREAMVSAFRIMGEGQLALQKFLLMTDQPVDLKDFRTTLETVLARCDVRTDLYVFANLSMDTLDYSGPEVNKGSKGVLIGLGDPIRKLEREFKGELPRGASASVFCGGCLVVSGPTHAQDPHFAKQLFGLTDWPLIVLVDDCEKATRSPERFLWTTFTRFEPAADIHAQGEVHRHHVVYEQPIVIDSRMKEGYPDELFCDPDTAATVSSRWKQYFPQGGVEMGDSDVAHLD
jgi:4-hydroxybenzoate decarboxylase subunit C